jgi:DNA mismatch repair ATPase MutS
MNKFDIDKQTLTDLNIFEVHGLNKSIFYLFNLTSTIKGNDKLSEIFRMPSTDIQIITERQGLIKYLSNYSDDLNFDHTNIDFIESYLEQNGKIKFYSKISALTKSINYFFYPNQAYYLKEKGIKEIISLLKKLTEIFATLDHEVKPVLVKEFNEVVGILFRQKLIKAIVERFEKKINLFEFEELDFMFKGSELKTIKRFLD